MAFQARSSGGAPSAAAPSASTAAFRAGRNEMASTLKAGLSAPHEIRSHAAAQARAGSSASHAGYAAAASSSPSFPAIGTATPRTTASREAVSRSGSRGGAGLLSPASPAGHFPSADKEESKEGAAAGAGSKEKDKDWNLWNGAPVRTRNLRLGCKRNCSRLLRDLSSVFDPLSRLCSLIAGGPMDPFSPR
jgi:hypothetical protein